MITECDLDPGCGGEIVNAVLAPFLRILPEGDPPGIRVNVIPGPEGSLDCGVPRIGLAALGEVLFALATAVVTPADLPPVALAVVGCGIELCLALLCSRHGSPACPGRVLCQRS
jgi:hypothetical protein